MMEYDDDNGKDGLGEVPTLRPSMDQADSRPPQGLSELQTDTLGQAEYVDDTPGWVYFIETEDGNYVKIGYSTRPTVRFAKLGTKRPSPFALRALGAIPGSYALERKLHQCFEKERDNGEWFRKSDRLQTFIETLALSLPVRSDRKARRPPPLPRKPPVKREDKEKNPIAQSLVALRNEKLSPERRKEIAVKAANTRWEKANKLAIQRWERWKRNQ